MYGVFSEMFKPHRATSPLRHSVQVWFLFLTINEIFIAEFVLPLQGNENLPFVHKLGTLELTETAKQTCGTWSSPKRWRNEPSIRFVLNREKNAKCCYISAVITRDLLNSVILSPGRFYINCTSFWRNAVARPAGCAWHCALTSLIGFGLPCGSSRFPLILSPRPPNHHEGKIPVSL